MRNRMKTLLLCLAAVPALAAARGAPGRGFEFIKEELGLSGETAEKVIGAFEYGRRTGKPLHDRLQTALEKLRWQVDAKADGKEIAATMEQVEKASAALREQREGVKNEVAALLTPEQRARLMLALGPAGMEPPPPRPERACGPGRPPPPEMGPGGPDGD